MPTKAVLYARVSKDDGTQDTDNQLIRLREYASNQDMTIIDEYVDRCSGRSANKPERARLLSDARGHRFSIVLCTKIDRISRSTIDFYDFLKQLNESRAKLAAVDQPELSTDSPTGELLMGILAAVSQFERALIVSRTLDGLRRAKAQGKRLGRPANHARTLEIAKLRQEGLTTREIGQKIGISRGAVRQRLRRARLQKGVEEQR